jgi:chitinase
VLDDRGGRREDYENYISIVQEMWQTFNGWNPGWGISMAIPASYWYLQHFDVNGLPKYVSCLIL